MSEPHRTDYTYLIIGAGPAGLQLGYFLQRAGANYLVLDRAERPGEFFRRYPRHRRLISLNKVHTVDDDPESRLRWDWHSLLSDSPSLLFPRYSREYHPHADDLVRYLGDFCREHQLAVRFGAEVWWVERVRDGFVVQVGEEVLTSRCLIVATGWGGPYVPSIPGVGYATGYERMSLDPERYRGKRILIIGKGNSAFETAGNLLSEAATIHLASPEPVRLAWNSKHPGHLRGQYGAVLDSYQFGGNAVLDCHLDRIVRRCDRYRVAVSYTHAEGEREVLEYDAVIRCAGFRMDTAIFGLSCLPGLTGDNRLPTIRPDWESSNVDDMYFAGTLMQSRDLNQASSASLNGFRYNLRTMARLLRERYEGEPYPCGTLAADPRALTRNVLARVNRSSALWNQFEYLCDAFVLDRRAGAVRHYEDLPEDYAVARFVDEPYLFTVSLRWGYEQYPDAFAIDRHPHPDRAAECTFLHPVIRRWNRGEYRTEQHLLEDLFARWTRPERHVEPLLAFFRAQLSGVRIRR